MRTSFAAISTRLTQTAMLALLGSAVPAELASEPPLAGSRCAAGCCS